MSPDRLVAKLSDDFLSDDFVSDDFVSDDFLVVFKFVFKTTFQTNFQTIYRTHDLWGRRTHYDVISKLPVTCLKVCLKFVLKLLRLSELSLSESGSQSRIWHETCRRADR
jgi:hypothetical protein